MHEIGESRLTKKTLLEHIGVHKRKHGGHILADKHLSGTAVNITGLIEQEAKQGDHSRLEMNRWGEGGWGEATQGDWVRRQEGMVEQNNEGLCEILH
jgi:hypothetical protein